MVEPIIEGMTPWKELAIVARNLLDTVTDNINRNRPIGQQLDRKHVPDVADFEAAFKKHMRNWEITKRNYAGEK